MALTSYVVTGAEDLTLADNYTFYNKVGIDSSGRIYIGYSRDTGVDDKPQLAYSDDDGQTWTEEQVDALSNYDRVALTLDSSDNVHYVCCAQSTANDALKYRKRNADDTWDATETITTDGLMHHCNIAIDSSGTLWVTATFYDGAKYILRVYKKPSGGSWSLSSTLTPAAGYSYKDQNMRIANNILHVAFAQREVADSSKVINKYDQFNTSTETWNGTETIDNGVSESVKMPPSGMVIESNNSTVWVFWENDGYGTNTGQKQIIYNKRSGGSWGSPTNLTDSPNRYAYTCATIADNDNIVMFYGHVGGDTIWDVYYQTWTGSSWSSEVAVAEDATSDFPIYVITNGTDTVYYFYVITQGDSTYDLYVSTDGGGLEVSVSVTITETPNLTIDANAVASVVAYKTPAESALPTSKNIDRFVLLRPTDSGYGDAMRIDTWGNVGITCVVSAIGTQIEIYVSNDGTDYVLRDTFTASGELNINAAYKYVKARQVSGSALVIFSGQKTTMMY